ncbi:restriction endonuclease subunit S [Anaerobacillus sp. 1_MG-2023]|uniref:restriction endonuclease subunit S n=1 Tax=Anaerobacillus sp. 1_MG-2023 TaxID=3062655 RepID=UPI0026E42C31|nr:restriction endonuclease subunit S [Anaerobacillus sp. 1_MG-2023]MDO6657370.1 restriction endonuclease subunit S [Anaerobacillus sp. 1_MG-2023]
MVTEVKGVTEGYKMTELGEIPEEWSIKKLGNIGVFKKGKGIAKKDLTDEGHPCVLYGELYTKYKETIEHIHSKTSVNKSKSVVGKYNDVLIPSSGETAFDIACASSLLSDDVLIGGDINIFTPNSDISGAFLSYLINSVRKNDLSKLAQGSSVYHLYSSALSSFLVMLPTLEEQQRIVETLSTVDRTIETTDQLLEKTKELKKGLMQQLLTKGIGHTEFKKTELGEIPVEWEVVKMDEVIALVSGQSSSVKEVNKKGIGVAYVTGPEQWDGKSIVENKWVEKPRKIAPVSCFFITVKGSGTGTIFPGGPFAIGRDIMAIVPSIRIERTFLYYLTTLHAEKIVYNKVGMVPGISRGDILEHKIGLPHLEEQRKIAEILSSVDEQIDIYTKEKVRLQGLKKGLMQQLLTGKMRVIV